MILSYYYNSEFSDFLNVCILYVSCKCWSALLYSIKKLLISQISKGHFLSMRTLSRSQWLGSLNFIAESNTIGRFLWSVRLTLFNFEKIPASYPSLNSWFLPPQTFRKKWSQGLRFNKVNIFSASSRIFLSETSIKKFFFNMSEWQ